MSQLVRAMYARWRSESLASRIRLCRFDVALLLRIAVLDAPIRLDERLTLELFVSRPWAVAVANYCIPNNHVFHTLLAKASVSVLGNSLWAPRLPAPMAGLLVVPVTYVAVRLLYGASAAMIATARVASSNEMVVYSTNARGYSLVTLAFLLLVILACETLKTERASGSPSSSSPCSDCGRFLSWRIRSASSPGSRPKASGDAQRPGF